MSRPVLILRITLGLVAAAFIGAVGLGTWLSRPEPPPPAAALRLGLGAPLHSALVWVALEQGYFAERGLSVEPVQYAAGRFALQGLLDGAVDAATTAEFSFMSRSFDHPELRVLASLAATEVIALVARRDAGIKTPGDLRGRRIGVTYNTDGHFFLDAFLSLHRIPPESVTAVDLGPDALVDALAAGRVDAVITWEPVVSKAQAALGGKAVTWPGQGGQETFWVLVTKAGHLDSHGEPLERLLAALLDAARYVAVQPEQTRAALVKRFGLEPDYVARIWPRYRHEVTLPQSLLTILEQGARWKLRAAGRADAPLPNYLDYLHPEPLERAQPRAVTLIRP